MYCMSIYWLDLSYCGKRKKIKEQIDYLDLPSNEVLYSVIFAGVKLRVNEGGQLWLAFS